MRIGIDVDETLRRSICRVVELYNSIHNENIKYENIDCWALDHIMNKEENISSYFTRFPGYIFGDAEIEDGAKEALDYLVGQGHEIWIVTHQYRGVEHHTLQWLLKHNIPYHSVVFTRDKSVIGCDVLIDDAVHNLLPFITREPNRRSICFNRAWNQEWKGERINKWSDIHKMF